MWSDVFVAALPFVLLIAGALAQGLTDLPGCAQTCFVSLVPTTGCELTATGLDCICSNSTFIAASAACIASGCSGADAAKAIQISAGESSFCFLVHLLILMLSIQHCALRLV